MRWLAIFLILVCYISFAQKQNEYKILKASKINASNKLNKPAQRDSVRVLAIMVEFEKDNDPQTTGDGSFEMTGSLTQIDPPPHDSLYFVNKLLFSKNYFQKVSNNKLKISGAVFGQSKKIKLSKKMSEYSPPTNSNDNRKLAELAQESWQLADAIYPEIDFSNYDVFLIFHAGAGRDIDLIGSLGYNPTPYDIPSLYLDSSSFAAALGVFSGISVDNGNVLIKNTIILPETESREISTASGKQKLQLSINGILVASIGSFLGLPDLFDTKTGRSGIGQFGLMDGAGIFAFSGLFPPEPCAWEKIWLGWANPILINSSSSNLTIPAVGLTSAGDDIIYKIPISQSEYFLIENRNRDPESNGQWLRIINGSLDTIIYFDKDKSNFNYLNVDGISGSVVDAENFDWAVIGYTDGTGKYDGGGILIWHIDENVIQGGMKTNTVNADIKRRGVDLMEADGSKDIGQKYESMSAGAGTENGDPLDCWFAGNSSPVYKNIFDEKSFPNSNSNTGAVSLITIKNFSNRSPQMTFSVEFGNNILKKDLALSRQFSSANTFPTSTANNIYLSVDGGITPLNNNGQTFINDPLGILSKTKTNSKTAVYQTSNENILVSVGDSTINIFRINPQGDFVRYTRKILSEFSTAPCFIQSDTLSIVVGASNGSIYQFDTLANILNAKIGAGYPITSITQLPNSNSGYDFYYASYNQLFSRTDSITLPDKSNNWILAGAVAPKGNNFIVAALKNGSIILAYDAKLSQKYFEISLPTTSIQEIAIADIDNDGEKDIIIMSLRNIYALNRNGFMLDGFPIYAKATLTGTPLIVDFDGDYSPDIISYTEDGNLWVYDNKGKLFSGFPIQATAPGKIYPCAYITSTNKLGMAAVSELGSLDALYTNTTISPNSLLWSQQNGNAQNTNADFSLSTIKPISAEFFPKSRVYNYPNPVYSTSTNIRFYTAENAEIIVTILDLTGVKVTELRGRNIGGMDGELKWDVTKIQSGVYYARVEAINSQKSEVAFIKISVVK